MYFNDTGSQLQNTVKFMGRPIEYVDCTDLLGVSVTSRIKERNVNSSVQKFYCRVNSVLYDFNSLGSTGDTGRQPPPLLPPQLAATRVDTIIHNYRMSP